MKYFSINGVMDQGMETLFRGNGTLTLLLALDLNGTRRNNKESFLFLPGPTTSRWLVSHRGAGEMEKAAYHKPGPRVGQILSLRLRPTREPQPRFVFKPGLFPPNSPTAIR